MYSSRQRPRRADRLSGEGECGELAYADPGDRETLDKLQILGSVILSGVAGSRSEAVTQSKDPLQACVTSGV